MAPKMSKVIIFVVVLSLILATASAHPGRTDSRGGHTCRTNCEKWGLDYGEYHYHNGGSENNEITSTPAPTPSPTPTPIITQTPTVTFATPIPVITIFTPEPTVYAPFDRSAIVTSIVDGDTVYVDYKEKVRFVGVNTPEIGTAGAQEAKDYVADRIKDKQVYLDVDDKKQQDKYGRTLAVIYIDNENLNKELLCKGYAEIMYIPPSEFNPSDWQASCPNLPAVTPIATGDAQLKQEISELKDRLNQTDAKMNNQEKKISWLEEMVNSLLKWFK